MRILQSTGANKVLMMYQLIKMELQINQEEKKEVFFILRSVADDIEKILREYLDLREEYYKLITVWIIGCHLHKNFSSYPYLFLNAMRGSGKSRALNLICCLGNGEYLTSLREAVLFRFPKNKLMGIDELEGIASKEMQGVREILNASYKKGLCVMRAKRVKTQLGDDYVLDKFEPFKPVVMANIWGMEEVLADRSITLILEKSSKSEFNMILEDFDNKSLIQDVKVRINNILVQLCSYFCVTGVLEQWNLWVKNNYRNTYTQTTQNTLNTLTTLENCPEEYPKKVEILYQEMFFESIARTGIFGRNLELFFPLFLISKMLGDEWLIHMLNVSTSLINDKKVDEMTASKDVSVYDFISRQLNSGYMSIKELTTTFREFIAVDGDEDNWVNSKWLGRALIRLNLIKEKRRVNKGVEVILDAEKARDKLKIFSSGNCGVQK